MPGNASICDLKVGDVAFAYWFIGSQVVDVDGAPLQVCHGTNKEGLTKFYGGWWSEDPRVTREFGDVRYAAYLCIRNPLEDLGSIVGARSPLHLAYERFVGEVLTREQIEDDRFVSLKDEAAQDGPFRDFLIDEGFDGLAVWDDSNQPPDAMAYVPFRPEQVRQARLPADDLGHPGPGPR